MRRLFRTNLKMLWKSKVFRGGTICMVLYCAIVCIDQYRWMVEQDDHYPLDAFLFGAGMMIGLVMSVWISLFVGTEYSDGTIRNKIVVGHTRESIYFSNFAVCAFSGMLSFTIAVLAVMLIGIPLFGFIRMEPARLGLCFADCLLACVSYAAIFNMIAMINANKTYTAIINLSAALLMLFLAIGLCQWLTTPEMMQQAQLLDGEWIMKTVRSPGYLTGLKREIYQFFYDFWPGGQLFQMIQQDAAHPYRLPFYSLVIIAVSNVAGMLLFRKKDLK